MNFTGPYSDWFPHGFPGWAMHGGEKIAMRKLTTSKGFPIPIADLLLDLRVDSDDEQRTIMRLARASAALLEKRSGISVLQGTYEAKFSGWDFYRPWEFMRSPLRVVKEISYLDMNASPPTWVPVDLDRFFITELAKSFLIMPINGVTLPVVSAPLHGVKVLFNAGFDIELTSGEDPGDQESGEGDEVELPIEDSMRTSLTMLTAHFYENREIFAADKLAQVEASAGSLFAANRMFW